MKANINLEIDKEDLNYELRSLVEEIAADEIRKLVKAHAEQMVKEEVKKIIAPIVDSFLETAEVGREYSYHSNAVSRRNVDEYVKTIIIRYLDEPVYLYSRSSSKLSERYNKSSEKSEATRSERWVNEKAREFVDKELFVKLEKRIEEVVKSLVPSEELINEIIKKEIQMRFR
ncbi:hypothetical protein CHH57_02025 [Niallia circulans]|uniref:Uncharacterized protein n=1 Tax=Niallia circulans TaxID=1397 RepID=A0AA91TVX4_NIACI|nr:hypothetical protein [Niallia circulans]PAD84975.1 hypothetical protein CHH57_02025 [Niallia circulans]